MLPHKNLLLKFYSSFTYNCQTLKKNKMSFNKWMDKQKWYIWTMKYYLALKRNEVMIHTAMKTHGRNVNAYFQVKKSSLKCLHIMWFQLYIFLEKVKLQRQECFLGGTSGKELTCQCRRHKRLRFDPWVGKIPWRRKWQPTPIFLPGESQGRLRSLAGYSP